MACKTPTDFWQPERIARQAGEKEASSSSLVRPRPVLLQAGFPTGFSDVLPRNGESLSQINDPGSLEFEAFSSYGNIGRPNRRREGGIKKYPKFADKQYIFCG